MEERVTFIGGTKATIRVIDTPIVKNLSTNRDRYIAQSVLTGILDKPYFPTVEEARDINRWASRGRVL